MFDSQGLDIAKRPLQAVSIGHLARESHFGLSAPRSYVVPVLLWLTCGQGRFSIDGKMRGYTAHNAIFMTANTSHAWDVGPRTQGTAVFFGGDGRLPLPEDSMHLRISSLQLQGEMNQHIDGLRRDSETPSPYAKEVLFHRAALTLLWLGQTALEADIAKRSASTAVAPPAMPVPNAATGS